jgi:hypothetical protein
VSNWDPVLFIHKQTDTKIVKKFLIMHYIYMYTKWKHIELIMSFRPSICRLSDLCFRWWCSSGFWRRVDWPLDPKFSEKHAFSIFTSEDVSSKRWYLLTSPHGAKPQNNSFSAQLKPHISVYCLIATVIGHNFLFPCSTRWIFTEKRISGAGFSPSISVLIYHS